MAEPFFPGSSSCTPNFVNLEAQHVGHTFDQKSRFGFVMPAYLHAALARTCRLLKVRAPQQIWQPQHFPESDNPPEQA